MAIGMWFVSVLLIVLVPGIFLVPYLASSGVLKEGNEKLAEFAATDPMAIIVQMVAIIPAHLITLFFAWVLVTSRGQYSTRDTLGWSWGGVRWWHYVLIFAAFWGLAMVVGNYAPETENQLIRILQSSRTAVFVVAFMATFTAPLVEEVIYRGVLYSAFQRSFGVPAAVVLVTLIFSLVHVPQYYESPATIFLLTILSLILTLMRVFSGSLLPSVIFHTMINASQSAGLILEPYFKDTAQPTAAAIYRLLQ